MDKVEIIQLNSDSDERGWVLRPFDDSVLETGRITNIHIVSIKPGSVRGNHFHRFQNEYVWVMTGTVELTALNNETGKKEAMIIEGETDGVMVKVPPGMTHAFKNTGDTNAYLFCASDKIKETEGRDSVRNEIVR
ncbi:MAG: cupin domain-containing protein [Actinobacteria bacterium]|nr:cupin domain-containing protein [Actinomycetota bacterium]